MVLAMEIRRFGCPRNPPSWREGFSPKWIVSMKD